MAPTGALLESSSLLGRFVGLSALNSDDTKAAAEVFGDPTNAAGVENTMVSVRAGVGLAQRALAAICKELFKNKEAKEGLFKYIAAACTLNQLRAQQYYQQSSEHARVRRPLLPAFMQAMEEQAPAARMASSEGFLVTLTSVLLGLCDPFTAPGSPHAAKIDSTYLLSKARLNLAGRRDCAPPRRRRRTGSTPRRHQAQAYDDERGEGAAAGDGGDQLVISSSFGTISEYFFLTMRLLVGVLPVFPVLKEITRECQQIEEHSDRLEQQLAGWATTCRPASSPRARRLPRVCDRPAQAHPRVPRARLRAGAPPRDVPVLPPRRALAVAEAAAGRAAARADAARLFAMLPSFAWRTSPTSSRTSSPGRRTSSSSSG